MSEYVSQNTSGTTLQRHPLLCRWWTKTRRPYPEKDELGRMHGHEIYVPFWAWPFELLHRLIFGKARFVPLRNAD